MWVFVCKRVGGCGRGVEVGSVCERGGVVYIHVITCGVFYHHAVVCQQATRMLCSVFYQHPVVYQQATPMLCGVFFNYLQNFSFKYCGCEATIKGLSKSINGPLCFSAYCYA